MKRDKRDKMVAFSVTGGEKKALEKMAEEKGLSLGAFLRSLCAKAGRDDEFNRLMRERQPEWFSDSATAKKKKLLSMPRGSERPVQKNPLGAALSNYSVKTSASYDAEFDRKIRARQPQWFVNTAEENKKKLLAMPVGCKRPAKSTRLGGALSRYLSPSSGSYDPEFTRILTVRQPGWGKTLVMQKVGRKLRDEKPEKLGEIKPGADPKFSDKIGPCGGPGWYKKPSKKTKPKQKGKRK